MDRGRYKMLHVNGWCVAEHRVVAEKYYGKIPKGYVVNHKNGIRNDNRPCNLEIVTYSENSQHAWRTGLRKPPRPSDYLPPNIKCDGCKKKWLTRVDRPVKCPNCKKHIVEVRSSNGLALAILKKKAK